MTYCSSCKEWTRFPRCTRKTCTPKVPKARPVNRVSVPAPHKPYKQPTVVVAAPAVVPAVPTQSTVTAVPAASGFLPKGVGWLEVIGWFFVTVSSLSAGGVL